MPPSHPPEYKALRFGMPNVSVGGSCPSVLSKRGSNMKIRTIALAGVAALALTGPALASDATGWYVDVSGGLDHMVPVRVEIAPLPPPAPQFPASQFKAPLNNSALVTGAWGYRFHDRIRVEGEIGYD